MHGCVFGRIFGRLNLPRGLMTSTYTSLIALNLSINCSLNNLLHRNPLTEQKQKVGSSFRICTSFFKHINPVNLTLLLMIVHPMRRHAREDGPGDAQEV